MPFFINRSSVKLFCFHSVQFKQKKFIHLIVFNSTFFFVSIFIYSHDTICIFFMLITFELISSISMTQKKKIKSGAKKNTRIKWMGKHMLLCIEVYTKHLNNVFHILWSCLDAQIISIMANDNAYCFSIRM